MAVVRDATLQCIGRALGHLRPKDADALACNGLVTYAEPGFYTRNHSIAVYVAALELNITPIDLVPAAMLQDAFGFKYADGCFYDMDGNLQADRDSAIDGMSLVDGATVMCVRWHRPSAFGDIACMNMLGSILHARRRVVVRTIEVPLPDHVAFLDTIELMTLTPEIVAKWTALARESCLQ